MTQNVILCVKPGKAYIILCYATTNTSALTRAQPCLLQDQTGGNCEDSLKIQVFRSLGGDGEYG